MLWLSTTEYQATMLCSCCGCLPERVRGGAAGMQRAVYKGIEDQLLAREDNKVCD